MSLQHLVFAAKQVGAKCVEYLLDTFPEDRYVFVLCEPGADAVAKVLDRRGHSYTTLGEETLAGIHAVPSQHYDWLLNLWGSHIFKADILSRARRSLNIHPAYLPYGRGRDPVVWAIRQGHPAGVTLHQITPGVDEGPIWCREELPYELPVRGIDLYERVVERCWQVFGEQWPKLRLGDRVPEPQQEGFRTYRRSELWPDRRLDADADLAIRDTILRLLAHDFYPGYTAQLVIGGKIYNVRLSVSLPAEASEESAP